MQKLLFPLLLCVTLISCYKDNTPEPGNNSSSLYDFKTLGGTTWVLASYHDTATSQMMYPNDTLVFIDSTHYTYNGIPCEYQYYFYHNSQATHLDLYTTPFGDLRAMVDPNAIDLYGEINGVQFSSLTGLWYMWFERL